MRTAFDDRESPNSCLAFFLDVTELCRLEAVSKSRSLVELVTLSAPCDAAGDMLSHPNCKALQGEQYFGSQVDVFRRSPHKGLRLDFGDLRKGYARNDLIAPEDADRVGERHGAAVRAGSQRHAAAKTTVADPVSEGMVLIYSLGDEVREWVRSCPR